MDLNLDKNNQRLYYNPFIIELDRYNGIWNTFNDPSGRICVRNKTDDVNGNVFDLITKAFESKTLTKHISCICKFDGRKFN